MARWRKYIQVQIKTATFPSVVKVEEANSQISFWSWNDGASIKVFKDKRGYNDDESDSWRKKKY